MKRNAAIAAAGLSLALGVCAPNRVAADTGLQQAERNYPPLIVGSNTDPIRGPVPFRACPAAGGRVEQKGGPTFEYLGASPKNPDLCRMRVGGQEVEAWYGIWLTDWPGAEQAYPAIGRIIQGGVGTIAGFDVIMAPGLAFHDVIRNEGVENLRILGHVYRALKLSHYREGFQGNIYRSVSTVWKDTRSGLLIYGTYQHIAGSPELEDPLIPTSIVPTPEQ